VNCSAEIEALPGNRQKVRWGMCRKRRIKRRFL
jgi:hypothetical protein